MGSIENLPESSGTHEDPMAEGLGEKNSHGKSFLNIKSLKITLLMQSNFIGSKLFAVHFGNLCS